jgi:hypothetical protein
MSEMKSGTIREALLVFLLFAFTYAYFYHDPGWNGNSRLDLAFAIIEEGRLTIDSYHDQVGTSTKDKAIYNGHYYTSKAIGSSLLAAFFYFPLYKLELLLNYKLSLEELKYLLTFFSIGLPSAVTGSLMYILCKQITGNKVRSFVVTIASNLGTMIFPFSVIFFGHQLAGSLLFAAFFLIYQLKVDPGYRRNGILLLVGFLLGFALITEYPVAPIVLILAAYYFFSLVTPGKMKRNPALVLPALGAVIPIIVLMAYNMAVFDNPISTGYVHSADPWFYEQQNQGLVGIGLPNPKVIFFMTIHPALGLFWQSPVLLLSIIGIWYMLKTPKSRAEALVAIFSFFSLLILYSGFYNWWGGWTFGPRYLIPMLLFLGLPLAFIPKRWFFSVVILGLISIIQMFIVVSTLILVPDNYYKQIENLGFFAYSSIYSYCLQLLLKGEFSTNLAEKFFNLNTWISLLPLTVVILIITIIFLVRRDHTNSFRSLQNQASH